MMMNPRRTAQQASDRSVIGAAHAAEVSALLSHCPAHGATPLHVFPDLAADLGVGALHVKAESERMGLGSFKALGGAYAVARLILAEAQNALGRAVAPGELRSEAVRAVAAGLTVVCASAGNHGLSVAAGAQAFGARAIVVLSEGVPERFAERLRERGAEVVRAGATYEDSMAFAAAEAEAKGFALVSDSSWPGYTETPLDVMRGYTVLCAEAADALDRDGGPATHVFVQAGVGGLAAAAVGYLRERWGEDFRFVVVEPEGAPCLLESVRQDRPVMVEGGPTELGRLDCKEPSLLAFDLLDRLADAFILISDGAAARAATRLSQKGLPISACGAAGLAGLAEVCATPAARERIGLDRDARVLVIGTEMAEAG